VVVGDLIGEGSAQEQSVVGETPNLAARLQTLALPFPCVRVRDRSLNRQRPFVRHSGTALMLVYEAQWIDPSACFLRRTS
jgi:hypothetical protein